MPITPLIHVTAAYSNAVLTAILPHVSDYSKKLNLDIPQPITASQVAHSSTDVLQGEIGGAIWTTNHFWFNFQNGYVISFRNENKNPYLDDDPAVNWKNYAFDKINMTTNEAVEFVRQKVSDLGYNIKVLHIDQSPETFSGGEVLKDGNPFPYCEMRWNSSGVTVNNPMMVRAQVNMNKKTLIALSIIGKDAWQTNPVVSVQPKLESTFKENVVRHMEMSTNASQVFPH